MLAAGNTSSSCKIDSVRFGISDGSCSIICIIASIVCMQASEREDSRSPIVHHRPLPKFSSDKVGLQNNHEARQDIGTDPLCFR